MKALYDKQKISRILDKFMSGESSMDEERLLAHYFRSHEVDAEWKEYQEMFALFDNGLVDINDEDEITTKQDNPHNSRIVTHQKAVNKKWKTNSIRWLIAGIAASILLIIGIFLFNNDEEPKKPVATIIKNPVKQTNKQEDKREEEQPIVTQQVSQTTPQKIRDKKTTEPCIGISKANQPQTTTPSKTTINKAEETLSAVQPPLLAISSDIMEQQHVEEAGQVADIETTDVNISEEMADIIACIDNLEEQLLSEESTNIP